MPARIATPPFEGFPPEARAFMTGLKANNDRAWFNANRQTYERSVKRPMDAFAAAIAERLEAQFDKGFRTHLFRINRDIRFSKNKTPYNAYLRAGFHPLPASETGFFFSFEPDSITLGVGLFYLDGAKLDAYRAAVADDVSGPEVQALVDRFHAMGMQLHGPDLRRVPAPYPPDHPRAELLKHKGLALFHDVTDFEAAAKPDFVDTCITGYATMAPLNEWLEDALGRAG